jgi:hypothetical protein
MFAAIPPMTLTGVFISRITRIDGGCMSTQQARFSLGRVVATPGALEALAEAGQSAIEFIRRHQSGDWGCLSDEDKRENEFSVDKELRIFSAYHTAKGEKIWIITEADRSVTTVLLPSGAPRQIVQYLRHRRKRFGAYLWVTQSACFRKGTGQLSILRKWRTRRTAHIVAPRDPRDMAKATLPEVQSQEGFEQPHRYGSYQR